MRQEYCTQSADFTSKALTNSGTKYRRLCAILCPRQRQRWRMWLSTKGEGSRLCLPDRLAGGCSVPPGYTSSCACGDHTTMRNSRTFVCAVVSINIPQRMQCTNIEHEAATNTSTLTRSWPLAEDGQVTFLRASGASKSQVVLPSPRLQTQKPPV